MSLPGLSNTEAPPSTSNATGGTVVEISTRSEWRIEVSFEEKVTIKITEGIAEIFGTELANDTDYTFTGQKLAIYSQDGAKVEYTGELTSEYISEETQLPAYQNLHFALSKIRLEQEKGPRVLIVGSKDSGKTTLSKILSSYANRMDAEPMYVNLNPADGVFALPGSLSAAPISDILDVQDGWGHSYTTGVTPLHPKQPTVRYYGYSDIHENLKLYKYNVGRLGVTVNARMDADTVVKKSGCIVDTPPLTIKDMGVIEDIVSDFEVNVICVLGNERLFIDIRKKFGTRLSVIKMPKSDGCVERDDAFMRQLQQRSIKEYFHGTTTSPLNPFTAHVPFSVIKVFKPYVESTNIIESSVLPIGEYGAEEEEEKKPKLLEAIEPSSQALLHCVVAILQADKTEEEDSVVQSSVLGYAVINSVDDTKKNVGILIPVPGRLPDKAMLLGSFRYVE